MITNEAQERVRGWFTGRVPEEWQDAPVDVAVDREEIIVRLTLADVELPERHRGGRGRRGPRRPHQGVPGGHPRQADGDRPARPSAGSTRKVSWQVDASATATELFTHVAAPVMTRLRQPQRQVLDTLVDAGVARSRSEALAWCVRLVGQHEDDWLAELREAMALGGRRAGQGPGAPERSTPAAGRTPAARCPLPTRWPGWPASRASRPAWPPRGTASTPCCATAACAVRRPT